MQTQNDTSQESQAMSKSPAEIASVVVSAAFVAAVAGVGLLLLDVNLNRRAQKVREEQKEREHELVKR